ncbi:uncharacterized protein LOC114660821 [Erpetoichthys calabaricus]|uniref:uncharacterized protein LOC114660821 n=1 Tax=Erpetoichthys calabaricus TaxID=27687 RepID=UPI00109FFF24|nr:uncharacterized protein LOC114660821 [Erpetoichthys calabaricus]
MLTERNCKVSLSLWLYIYATGWATAAITNSTLVTPESATTSQNQGAGDTLAAVTNNSISVNQTSSASSWWSNTTNGYVSIFKETTAKPLQNSTENVTSLAYSSTTPFIENTTWDEQNKSRGGVNTSTSTTTAVVSIYTQTPTANSSLTGKTTSKEYTTTNKISETPYYTTKNQILVFSITSLSSSKVGDPRSPNKGQASTAQSDDLPSSGTKISDPAPAIAIGAVLIVLCLLVAALAWKKRGQYSRLKDDSANESQSNYINPVYEDL